MPTGKASPDGTSSAVEDARISALETRMGQVEEGLSTLDESIRGGLKSLWKAHDEDKKEARSDAERRHTELMAGVEKINGCVRDHAKEIVRLKTQHEEDMRHREATPPGGKVVVEHEDKTGGTTQIIAPAQTRIGPKEIAYAGGGAGGVLGVVWLIWKILETVIEAVQAASGGVVG